MSTVSIKFHLHLSVVHMSRSYRHHVGVQAAELLELVVSIVLDLRHPLDLVQF